MITRHELAAYLHTLLACENFNDYAPNGLQVEGHGTIRTICTAVTASAEVIKEACQLQADALIVHHGYFWKGEEAVLTGIKYRRIAELIRNNINLFAYHLPLDCHPTLGNNACLSELFAAKSITSHRAGNTPGLLWSGFLQENITAEEWILLLTKQLQRAPVHIAGSDKVIRHIAWCSGAAQDFIEEAYALGADAYLSGEISERTYYQAKELGLHYFSCGHHATERYGIQALGQHLVNQFDLVHYFIDSNNPI